MLCFVRRKCSTSGSIRSSSMSSKWNIWRLRSQMDVVALLDRPRLRQLLSSSIPPCRRHMLSLCRRPALPAWRSEVSNMPIIELWTELLKLLPPVLRAAQAPLVVARTAAYLIDGAASSTIVLPSDHIAFILVAHRLCQTTWTRPPVQRLARQAEVREISCRLLVLAAVPFPLHVLSPYRNQEMVHTWCQCWPAADLR